jgi:hypothetical protein
MATQESILKFKGQLDGMSFFKGKNGYSVRKKGGVSAERVMTDPKFTRTRENGEEFGRAVKGSKLIRAALRTYTRSAKDGTAANRLTRALMKVLQGDTTSPRGKRIPMIGDFNHLFGFEFNNSARLSTTFNALYSSSVDRETGVLSVSIPEFVPANAVTSPLITQAQSGPILLGGQTVPATVLNVNVAPQSGKVLILLMAINFHQMVNNTLYPLSNGAFNALTILHASKA